MAHAPRSFDRGGLRAGPANEDKRLGDGIASRPFNAEPEPLLEKEQPDIAISQLRLHASGAVPFFAWRIGLMFSVRKPFVHDVVEGGIEVLAAAERYRRMVRVNIIRFNEITTRQPNRRGSSAAPFRTASGKQYCLPAPWRL